VDPQHHIGNIEDASFRDLIDSAAQIHFGASKHTLLPHRCHSCEWLAVCGGGCPKDRFVAAEEGGPNTNYLCAGLYKFFSYAGDSLKKIFLLGLQKTPAAVIMNQFRAESLAKWRRTGRNDPCPCGSGRKAKHCCLRR
jgi:uncharacterized protein